ncbi:MAG TPA: AMP-binding protein, partial [Rhodospirillales bacterium]|nr:AMP-binding protein [Rhodospirillales bacterium]
MFHAPRPTRAYPPSERTFGWRSDGTALSVAGFHADVAVAAERLPELPHAINLCEDRYLFTVAFLAVATRGQACLLPASRAERDDIAQAGQTFGGSYRLLDGDVAAWIGNRCASEPGSGADGPLPRIPDDQVVAVPFTSGSTGRSQPHPKRWGELVAGAHLAERRFGFAAGGISGVVATVPAQHMYGLETSVMVPLVIGIGVYGSRPFFPADICCALAAAGPQPVLVTTPVHLSACVDSGVDWPPLAFIISATAPLPAALAMQAEARMAAPVLEIFGFTEAGSIASRRTVRDPDWHLYDGMTIRDNAVSAAHLPAPVAINDIIEARGVNRFALIGRPQDLVNVAGKRTSLLHLNRVLCEIDGVVDGAFVLPDEDSGGCSARLAAAVVAPTLRREHVLAALAPRIDPLFIPRPLLMADRLPRNDNGKLP